jgi:pimeloyl-ACP methyl ester carboxylesterase
MTLSSEPSGRIEPVTSATVRTTDGVGLHTSETGRGDPVICISGLGYSSWCWRESAEALAPNHRVITFDNRGTGQSSVPVDGYRIDRFADDAADVLTTLGAVPAHVIGHSMGGYIALTLASRHPELVRSLVLIGTSSGGAGHVPVPEVTQSAWRSASDLPPDRFARETMPWSYATGWSAANPERFEALLAARVQWPTSSDVWNKQFRAAGFFGRDGVEASAIAAPALVIHGTDDRVVPFANGQRLASQLPGARFVPLTGAGHLCFLEDPGGFQRIVAEWLRNR